MIRKTLLIGLIGGMVLLISSAGGAVAQPDANETEVNSNASLGIGAQVQLMAHEITETAQANVEAYGVERKLNAAENESERKQIIEEELSEDAEEQQSYQSQKRALIEAKQRGELSGPEFALEMQKLQISKKTEDSEMNATAEAAAEHNVSVNQTKLELLQNNANNMTGQEVSAIARTLVDTPASDNRPDHAGPPTNVGAEVDNESVDAEVNIGDSNTTDNSDNTEDADTTERNNTTSED